MPEQSFFNHLLVVSLLSLVAAGLSAGTVQAQRPDDRAARRGSDSPPADTTFEERRGELYNESWIDFNKNGERDPYEDASLPVDERVDDLLGRMTLEEKTMQMVTLYGYGYVLQSELPQPSWNEAVWKDGIANIDEHVNAQRQRAPTTYTYPHPSHARVINEVQRWFVEETRLGIPVDFSNEGIRGLAHDRATSFPAQIGQGSTFDAELVGRIGGITGREARALGYTNVYAPILDVARDPRWGRTPETYGESPHLAATLGAEMVRGLQDAGVAATPKHYGVYSVPKGGRDGQTRTDPHVTPRAMHELYLRPFRRAFAEAGAMGTMSSYNDWNGLPVTGSRFFLTELLREQYGFEGYVVSDSRAVIFLADKHGTAPDRKGAVRQAVDAGLNVRTDFTSPGTYVDPLRELVREGRLTEETIDRRVADVLQVKMQLGLFDQPYVEDPSSAFEIVGSDEAEALSRRAARESLVLLKNAANTLPLDRGKLDEVLVTGPMGDATSHATTRYGPSGLEVTSIVEGVRAQAGSGVRVEFAEGVGEVSGDWLQRELSTNEPIADSVQAGIERAADQAAEADIVIAALGGHVTVGESKSRTSLELPGHQQALLRALEATGTPVILVLVNGRPLTINWADEHVEAILEAWFPGRHTGRVVAEALFGTYSPGGRLPITFPKAVGQIPYNFPTKRGAQASQGQWTEQQTRVEGVLYPFGHGLSYTSFAYSNLSVTPEKLPGAGTVTVTFEVTNTGDRPGDAVPQLYLRDPVSSVVHYEKQLRGFERLSLDPGETEAVSFTLDSEDLWLLDRHMEWTVEQGRFEIEVGSSSEDVRLEGSFEITETATFARPPRE